ncbi:GNAT family N-acetyltransferase [Paenibacillus sp. N3/727]|uniref:GNAT family N-acetyltransferase n=1 Tax=Paenibacillus sp. N3/727 TaxID=2925845 RepID=UPI001F534E66|nr:GNAT family N-acetyltransferase [Paenibacillus sp. N3/727]UNK15890.1 GNAT family N-acetyltransferase [Paenibacillus sp. N3/727]
MGLKPDLKLLNYDMLDDCVDLFMDTFSKEPWNDVYESRKQVVDFFEHYMKNNYFIGYVLKIGDELVGLSLGAKKPYLKGMEYFIDQFCVCEKFQGQGVGSKFLELIESDIKKQDINTIVLTTSKGFPSEKFYIKNGFKTSVNAILLAK